MKAEMWYLVIGGLFVLVTLAGTLIRRSPISMPTFYLLAGVLLGPMALGMSVVAHGVSVTPLMSQYRRAKRE